MLKTVYINIFVRLFKKLFVQFYWKFGKLDIGDETNNKATRSNFIQLSMFHLFFDLQVSTNQCKRVLTTIITIGDQCLHFFIDTLFLNWKIIAFIVNEFWSRHCGNIVLVSLDSLTLWVSRAYIYVLWLFTRDTKAFISVCETGNLVPVKSLRICIATTTGVYNVYFSSALDTISKSGIFYPYNRKAKLLYDNLIK